MKITENAVNDMNRMVYANNDKHKAQVYRPYADPKNFVPAPTWSFDLYTLRTATRRSMFVASGEGFKTFEAAMQAAEKASKAT